MKRFVLCLCALCCALPAHAQIAGAYRWQDFPNDDSEIALMQFNGLGWQQVGTWSHEGEYYQPLIGGGWGERCQPPIPPTVGRYVPRRRNFGMDYKPRRQTGEKYTDQEGRVLSREQAVDAIRGRRPVQAIEAPVPDDSAKLKGTVIDTDAARRERLRQALLQTGVATQAYDPAGLDALAWAVKRYGYRLDSPQVYVQDPGGKVFSRTPREISQAEATAVVAKAETMRNPNPQYDATKDPDLTQPLAVMGLNTVDVAAGGSSLVAILAAALFGRRRGGVS